MPNKVRQMLLRSRLRAQRFQARRRTPNPRLTAPSAPARHDAGLHPESQMAPLCPQNTLRG
jgi:hypothetical protein